MRVCKRTLLRLSIDRHMNWGAAAGGGDLVDGALRHIRDAVTRTRAVSNPAPRAPARLDSLLRPPGETPVSPASTPTLSASTSEEDGLFGLARVDSGSSIGSGSRSLVGSPTPPPMLYDPVKRVPCAIVCGSIAGHTLIRSSRVALVRRLVHPEYPRSGERAYGLPRIPTLADPTRVVWRDVKHTMRAMNRTHDGALDGAVAVMVMPPVGNYMEFVLLPLGGEANAVLLAGTCELVFVRTSSLLSCIERRHQDGVPLGRSGRTREVYVTRNGDVHVHRNPSGQSSLGIRLFAAEYEEVLRPLLRALLSDTAEYRVRV